MYATLIILVLSAALFVSGRLRSDLVAVCAALALVLCGVLTAEEAIAGFSNPIVIMMAGLFVVGGGIFSTGLAEMAGRRILGLAGRGETRLFVLLMVTTAVVGAFVSNTGTVALMLPIVVGMARAAGLPPARFLMPLAFAGSMGGMLTLIGTPPNLIVRDALVGAGVDHAPGFFGFTPVGVVCVVVGIVVLIPLSRRYLGRGEAADGRRSAGKTPAQLAEEYRVAGRVEALRVVDGSPVAGRTVRELDVHGRYGITVIETRRTRQQSAGLLRRVEQYAAADVALAPGDVLYLSGTPDQIRLFAADARLEALGKRGGRRHLRFYEVGMVEVLLLPSSPLDGRTVAEAGFRNHYGVNVLGVRRHGDYLLHGLKDLRLHASDVVLVQGPWDNLTRLAHDGDKWVVMGQPDEAARRVTLDYKAPVAAAIMLLMVLCMAVDFIPVAPVTAVVAAAVLMIFSGCLRNVEEAYRTINWESIVLFGAMLPMSTALEKTGASELISHFLVQTFGGFGPYVLLATVYLATSLLTFFISNTVTAVLMAPIALGAASGQGLDPVPFLMAVTVAASMCFASPFSTPPNALVMSAGGYKPVDYVKVGLPLQLVMAVVMIVVLPLLFPFG